MDQSNLRETLGNRDQFLKLGRFFIDKAIEESKKQDTTPGFRQVIEKVMENLLENNTKIIFKYSESPIETILLNSLALCFLKNLQPLILTQPFSDLREGLHDFRKQLADLDDMVKWYVDRYGSEAGLDEYLDKQAILGKMDERERFDIDTLLLFYHTLWFRKEYHLSIQSSLPDIKIDVKGIRPDLFFWMPAQENFQLVVECDGFQHHSSRKSFVTDRKRDRALKMIGCEVLRFSGNELFLDPVEAGGQLYDYLCSRQQGVGA